MLKDNLKDFFKDSEFDISKIINEPNILILHILHLYHIIKDWYIDNKYGKITFFNELIENKNYINKIFDDSHISNLTQCGYCSILYNESFILNNIGTPCLDYIHKLYKENILYYTIYISTAENRFIIFNYKCHKRILLINIDNLNITEFVSINECLDNLSKTINNNFNYQVIRVVKRPYSFD
jgi:hypothetical protein